MQVGNQRGHLPSFTTSKLKKKLNFKIMCCRKIKPCKRFVKVCLYKKFIATRQGGFIVLHVWEIVVRKNLTIFEGCHFARFYILIWWSFPKIETKNFNSDPCFFKLVKLGTISPAAHFLNCVHIGRRQTIAAMAFVGFLLENTS